MASGTNFQIYLTESLLLLKKKCSRHDKLISDNIDNVLTNLKKKQNDTRLKSSYFLPFKMACESRKFSLIDISLDCLQKLISTDKIYQPVSDPNFIAKIKQNECNSVILKTTCECYPHLSETVCLKVLRNILTLITVSYNIHEKAFFCAIKTCLQILITCDNIKIKTCAKATLTQLIYITFQKANEFKISFDKLQHDLNIKQGECDDKKYNIENKIKINIDDFEGILNDKKSKSAKEICREIIVEIINNKMIKNVSGAFGICVNCKSPSDYFCIQTKEAVCSMDCKIKNLQKWINSKKLDKKQKHILSVAMLFTLFKNDTVLLFKSLADMANVAIKQTYSEEDKPFSLKSKEISLELILNILKSHFVYINGSPDFLEIMKGEIFNVIIENVFYKYISVNSSAICIFLQILRNYKTTLKFEIGVFLEKVFVPIIESENSTFKQKLICLMIFMKICSKGQWLMDVFYNYDCNSIEFNVFKRIIRLMETITQQKLETRDWIFPEQEVQIKILALECIQKMFESLSYQAERKSSKSDDKKSAKNHLVENESSSNSSCDTEDGFKVRYTEKKEREIMFNNAINKFNESPDIGMKMLKSVNFVKDSPLEIAEFLFNNEKLQKEAIGKFLGAPQNAEVLSSFTFLFEFNDLDIDVALRIFLSKFLLVGESQIIDRVMEKFSFKYCLDNPKKFNSTDSVHILAFSIIMLNTDLYSGNVSRKMSQKEFVDNNMRVIQSENIDRKILEEIYDRISSNEIKFEEPKSKKDIYVSPKTRESLFFKEENAIKDEVLKMLKKRKTKKENEENSDEFLSVKKNNLLIIYQIFELVWSSSLASMSILMENSDNPEIVNICLDTYKQAINIATIFKMDIVKDAYVNTLAVLTLMWTGKEMKPKNIKAIQTILDIAYFQGNCLDASWLIVLKCISYVEKLHLVGSGITSDSKHFRKHKERMNEIMVTFMSTGVVNVLQQDENEDDVDDNDPNTKAIAYLIDQRQIDRIFINSEKLEDGKIQKFLSYLCQVAKQELLFSEPRIFSLEKIVETSYYNLERKIETWKAIWNDLEDMFISGGSIKNQNASKYVINSFRLIVTRFLKKPQFYNDQEFQRMLFSPLISIVENVKTFTIREIIIQCMFQIVQSVHFNLDSSWIDILLILKITVEDSREKLVSLAFDLFKLVEKSVETKILIVPGVFSSIIQFLFTLATSYLKIYSIKAIESLFYYLMKMANLTGLINETTKLSENEIDVAMDGIQFAISMLIKIIFSQHINFDTQLKTLDSLENFLCQIKKSTSSKNRNLTEKFWPNCFDQLIVFAKKPSTKSAKKNKNSDKKNSAKFTFLYSRVKYQSILWKELILPKYISFLARIVSKTENNSDWEKIFKIVENLNGKHIENSISITALNSLSQIASLMKITKNYSKISLNFKKEKTAKFPFFDIFISSFIKTQKRVSIKILNKLFDKNETLKKHDDLSEYLTKRIIQNSKETELRIAEEEMIKVLDLFLKISERLAFKNWPVEKNENFTNFVAAVEFAILICDIFIQNRSIVHLRSKYFNAFFTGIKKRLKVFKRTIVEN